MAPHAGPGVIRKSNDNDDDTSLLADPSDAETQSHLEMNDSIDYLHDLMTKSSPTRSTDAPRRVVDAFSTSIAAVAVANQGEGEAEEEDISWDGSLVDTQYPPAAGVPSSELSAHSPLLRTLLEVKHGSNGDTTSANGAEQQGNATAGEAVEAAKHAGQEEVSDVSMQADSIIRNNVNDLSSIDNSSQQGTLADMSKVLDPHDSCLPAVVDQLLSPSATVVASPSRSMNLMDGLSSSADPDLRESQLFPQPRNGRSITTADLVVQDPIAIIRERRTLYHGLPQTSTPAGSQFELPHPMSVIRSSNLIEGFPVVAKPTIQPSCAKPAQAFYQSTSDGAAMFAAILPKAKKANVEKDEEEEDEHEDDEQKKVNSIEEGDELAVGGEMAKVAAAPSKLAITSEVVTEVPASPSPSQTQLHESIDLPTSLSSASTSTFPPGHQPSAPHATSSSVSAPYHTYTPPLGHHRLEQTQSVDGEDERTDPISLSLIGDLPSSYEPGSQLVIEMTQLDSYRARHDPEEDVEEEQEEEENEVEEDIAEEEVPAGRPIPAFAHDSGSFLRPAPPPPGRELRRATIPSTPSAPSADSLIAASSSQQQQQSNGVNGFKPSTLPSSALPSSSSAAARSSPTSELLLIEPSPSSKSLPVPSAVVVASITNDRSSTLSIVLPDSEGAEGQAAAPSAFDVVSTVVKERAVPISAAAAPSNERSKATSSDRPSMKTTPRSKGKRKAIHPSSPDELDLLHQKSLIDETFDEREDDVDMRETNYDDLPGPHSHIVPEAQHRKPPDIYSNRSTVVSGYETRAGSKRKAVESPIDAAAGGSSKKQKKEKIVIAAISVLPAKGKRKATQVEAEKAKSKSKLTSALSKAANMIGGIARGRPKKAKAPVASSSRLRTASITESCSGALDDDEDEGRDDVDDAAAMSDAERVAVPQPSIKKSSTVTKSALPTAAPFSRIFGVWRTDRWLYPGTIVATTSDGVKVLFDDESKGNLAYSELRRCQLVVGDYVRYRGDEADMDTQVAVPNGDVKVMRVEHSISAEDRSGDLDPEDIVVGTASTTKAGGTKIERFTLASSCIPHSHSKQFDDRRLSAVEIAGFRGQLGIASNRASSSISTNVIFYPVPIQNAKRTLRINSKPDSLFRGMGFVVTLVPEVASLSAPRPAADKDDLVHSIESNGGTIVAAEDLFTVRGTNAGEPIDIDFSIPSFAGINTIILLSDRPSATPKYLISLALEIPCVSSNFVDECIKENTLLDWQRYIIASGSLVSANNAFVMGPQVKSIARQTFDLSAISRAHVQDAILNGQSILVVLLRKKKEGDIQEYANTLRKVLGAAGALRVDFVTHVESAADAIDYDYVMLEKAGAISKALKRHAGICDVDWLKQCLISGRLVPVESI